MKKDGTQKNFEYYLGLDIGTDSVGYAVTDTYYNLKKFNGRQVWGVTTFEEASQSGERRSFREGRRRLDRRQWRLRLLSEIFAEEIAKVDPRFFIRLRESDLYREDASDSLDRYIFFNDNNYNDRSYFKDYPTIHHLIFELMTSSEPHDIRLVYLAIAWLTAHRGHFFGDISIENVDAANTFEVAYGSLKKHFEDNDFVFPWETDAQNIFEILKEKKGVREKEKELCKYLKNNKDEDPEQQPYDPKKLIKLLCGGKVSAKDLYLNSNGSYDELKSFSLSDMSDEEYSEISGKLGDNAEIIVLLKRLYDAVALDKLLNGKSCVSEAKISVYIQHREDLKNLKRLIREYVPEKYNEVFRFAAKDIHNYVAYSYNLKYVKNRKKIVDLKKADKKEFYDYIKKIIKTINPKPEDESVINDILARIDSKEYMPKQVDGDNRLIPYQLYYSELEKILNNASSYFPFLTKADGDGISPAEKIRDIFKFKIPYFVGPLHKGENPDAKFWMVRRESGRIFPWNFDEMVDYDKSEEEFIRSLTNSCTYLPAKDVLPKDSLLYSKFCVLNEINNIKIDGKKISVDLKQRIYNELFMKKSRVTVKNIKDFCVSNGYMDKNGSLEGLDESVKSSLKSYIDFRRFLANGILKERDVEAIIKRSAYSEDKSRFRKWLKDNYPALSEEDKEYICRKNYKDFGRLSEEFLSGLYGTEKDGCTEAFSVIEGLWNTDSNLMQLLSEKYTFRDEIERRNREYFSRPENKMSLSERLDKLYVSNAVKRPIIRTFDIISEICKVMGGPPSKIFLEMARGAKEEEKGRTVSRKDQIEYLYENIKGCNISYENITDKDISDLKKELAALGEDANNKLQSTPLFLYFLQLGKCMYTEQSIDFHELLKKTNKYNKDHIYPQSRVKDDSIKNNLVLVLSEENGHKEDNYPIEPRIRENMAGYWKYLHDINLISDEKYRRLTRTTPFSDDEKTEFINRQLVETRQATKAVADLLKERFGEKCELVYVKAGLVSDFRHQYDMHKSRAVNDLHHAKDAYLNIVVGNVYDMKFSKKWFSVSSDEYSMKTENIFKFPVKIPGGSIVWKGQEDIGRIKNIYKNNIVRVTRYPFCRKGGLFDQQPCKADKGLIPRKKGLPSEKYGGYNKPKASFFVPVHFCIGKKSDTVIISVNLMIAEKFKNDPQYREKYARETILSVFNKKVESISFPLGDRILKVNTLFDFDGLRMCLSGKSSGGRQLGFQIITPFICGAREEEYIRNLEKFDEKAKKNEALSLGALFTPLNKEKNLALYDLYIKKLGEKPYSKRPNNPLSVLKDGRDAFVSLSVFEQAKCLLNIQTLFGRGAGRADLALIGGSKNSGNILLSATLSNWKKDYSSVRVIDQSAAGIFENKTDNLLELL